MCRSLRALHGVKIDNFVFPMYSRGINEEGNFEK
jgi:hypothetical protein